MPKVANYITINNIQIDSASEISLHRQLYDALRYEILNGTLKPGMRLPSTRAFAKKLGISRNTVSSAFNQLLTEGYIESKVGSGTRVTRTLPEEALHVDLGMGPPALPPSGKSKNREVVLSNRGEAIAKIPYDWESHRSAAFNSALPSTEGFPFKEWEKLLLSGWQEIREGHLGYYSAKGYLPLRESLSDYLQIARGVRCTAEHIIITNGAQQAVTLVANLLLNPNDEVWVENPCYPGIRAALSGALARSVPIPVDEEGLDVEAGIALAPDARLAYVSPSHQYPLGVTMSLTRRLQLLQWAEENGSWIVEDDYDSEYRYVGYPVPAVQGLDRAGRVIYVGTFSKVMFPSLRIGYLVLPDLLVEPFHAARAHADRGSGLLEQAALAKFIELGHLSRHVRRMRTQYTTRQALMVSLIEQNLGEQVQMKGTESGLHCVLWLPKGVDDAAVSAALAKQKISAPALSTFALTKLSRGGLVLGFAALPEEEVAPNVIKLCNVVRGFLPEA